MECAIISRLVVVIALTAACEVVPPGDDAGSGPGKVPGDPFSRNVCFQCSLNACSVSARACNLDALCLAWLKCVAACPTDKTGVTVDFDCAQPCGLPVSAGVLAECIQNYSTGFLLGCEQACEPLPRTDAGRN